MFRFVLALVVMVIIMTCQNQVQSFAPTTTVTRTTPGTATTLLSASSRSRKHGKAVVPPRLRHDYTHAPLAREQRNEGMEPVGVRTTDRLPVFNLFVRAHRRQVSIVCGRWACVAFLRLSI